jgi:type IX secretion system PorP/SprF family membrane protein
MSSPSFSNIDRWLFEWNEGNLTSEQIEQLKLFLLLHPELEVDRDMWENAHVDSDKIVFPHAENLKRQSRVIPFLLSGSISALFLIVLGITFWLAPHSDSEADHFLGKKQHSLSLSSTQHRKVQPHIQHVSRVEHVNLTANRKREEAPKQFVDTQNDTNEPKSDIVRNNTIRFAAENEHYEDENVASLIDLSESIDEFKALKSSVEPQYDENSQDITTSSTVQTVFKANDQNSLAARDLTIDTVTVKEMESAKAKSSEHVQSKSTGNGKKMDLSIAMRWRKLSRTVKRMMDNPVALKNVKDPIYLTPGMQPMDVNFGAAGKLLSTRVQATSRAQWLNQDQQQFINQVAIDGYSYGLRGGLGIQLNQSYFGNGSYQDANAAVIYSPKISLTREITVEPSIRFKMGNKMIDPDKLSPGMNLEIDRSQVACFQGSNTFGNSLWYRDLGVGMLINTKWFYVGGQVDNVMRHHDNMFDSAPANPSRASYHTVLSIGTEYESIRKTASISPYIVYQKKEDLEETWFGAQFKYHWMTVGLSMSDQLEPAASIGIKFKHFMLVYSADYLKSAQMKNSSLSHQLSLRITTKPSRFAQRLLNQ